MTGTVQAEGHVAELELPCVDEAAAKAVEAAVAPEIADGPEGSQVVMMRKGGVLHVRVASERAATLRAALHSVIRLVDAAQRTLAAGQST